MRLSQPDPSATPSEALARIAGELADAMVVTTAADMHKAISGRVFRAVGPAGRPVQVVHDAIAGGVYGIVRRGVRGSGAAGAGVLRARRGASADDDPRRLEAVVSVVNGFVGDRLEAEGHPLAISAALRCDGADVPPAREALADAFPAAAPDVVVFVHGLAEGDGAWRAGEAAARDGWYGERLARDHGWTSVGVRYNSGRHVSDNARDLAALLAAMVAAWPVTLARLALVGHSMGGLVARGAAHHAAAAGMRWPRALRSLVMLGAPHGGVPLEKAVHVLAAALGVAPESRPLAGMLRLRSAGIRDLRHGALREEDWLGRDPEALLGGHGDVVPVPEGVDHLLVAATLNSSPRHVVSVVSGDLLVRRASASGRGRVEVREESVRHVGGLGHFALLCHPRVYELLAGHVGETGGAAG